MKAIIISDTHRHNENYFKVMEMHQPDFIVHCGDVEGSEYALTQGVNCPVYMVSGNNDFFSELPRELEFQLGKWKCFLTHGHHYYISMGPERLLEEGLARGASLVFCGHTHKPEILREDGITLVNPGSISYPRQEGRRPSYVIMEEDRHGELHFTIAYL